MRELCCIVLFFTPPFHPRAALCHQVVCTAINAALHVWSVWLVSGWAVDSSPKLTDDGSYVHKKEEVG